MRTTIIGLGGLALALTACGGGGNTSAPANAANAAAPAGKAAAPQEPPRIPINEQLMVDACLQPDERTLTIDQLTPARKASLNSCYNMETVRQLTPQLPIRVDGRTQVDQVSVAGQDLVYRYRVSQRLAEFRPGTAERLDAHTRANACAGEDVRQIIALGGAQVYRWVDRDGALIREVRIASCPEAGSSS